MPAVLKFNRLEKSFEKWLHSYKMFVPADYSIKDLRLFTKENKPAIVRTIDSEFKELGPVKVNFTFYICLTKEGIKGTDRPSKYRINDGLDFSGISFPTPLNEISKVETKNYLAINVFGWAGNRVIVRRISPVENPNTQRINLMLITQDKQLHYCQIKSFNRLCYDQHNTGHKVFFCERCPQGFSSQNVLKDHLSYCRGIKCRPENKIEMPKECKNILKFENYQNQMKVPWIIYADFESLVEKIYGGKPDPSGSSTTKTEVHMPCGFGFMAVRSDGETMDLYVYRGKNTVKDLLYYLQIVERDIRNDLHKKATFYREREDWADYNKAS